MGVLSRLYNGETRFDFIGRAKLWFLISGIVILVGVGSLVVRGLNLGLDFEGGTAIIVPSESVSVEDAREVAADLGYDAKVQELTSDEGRRLRVQTEFLEQAEELELRTELAELAGEDVDDIAIGQSVGPSWGRDITEKAIRALVFFLLAILAYVTIRFEFKMALGTIAALVHDLLVTVGVYSLFGFEVTPATVTAFLTILGFSIYDGIVVFDRVDENTRLVSSTSRLTYSDVVNVSLNQTLMRSLNTQITALIPMLSLLVIGSFVLGASTLEEFALALVVGQFAGAYSSIFIASPMLAILKEREPRFRDVRRRIEARQQSSGGGPSIAPDEELVPAAVGTSAPAPVLPRPSTGGATPSGAIPPRPRKKKR